MVKLSFKKWFQVKESPDGEDGQLRPVWGSEAGLAPSFKGDQPRTCWMPACCCGPLLMAFISRGGLWFSSSASAVTFVILFLNRNKQNVFFMIVHHLSVHGQIRPTTATLTDFYSVYGRRPPRWWWGWWWWGSRWARWVYDLSYTEEEQSVNQTLLV